MNEDELIELLKVTKLAIIQYNNQEIEKLSMKSTTEKLYHKIANKKKKTEIEKEAGELVKVAFMIGLSGQLCPRCNGTGRI